MLATKKREYPVQRPHVFEQAKQAEQASEIDKAESLYRKIILGELDHIDAGLGLARLHFDREYYLESYLLLEHLEAIDPENQTILSLKQKIETYYQAFGVVPFVSDDKDYDITNFEGGIMQTQNTLKAPKLANPEPEPPKLEEQPIESQAIGETPVELSPVEEKVSSQPIMPQINLNITEIPPDKEIKNSQESQKNSSLHSFNGAFQFVQAVEYIIEFDAVEEEGQVPSPQLIKINLSDDF